MRFFQALALEFYDTVYLQYLMIPYHVDTRAYTSMIYIWAFTLYLGFFPKARYERNALINSIHNSYSNKARAFIYCEQLSIKQSFGSLPALCDDKPRWLTITQTYTANRL